MHHVAKGLQRHGTLAVCLPTIPACAFATCHAAQVLNHYMEFLEGQGEDNLGSAATVSMQWDADFDLEAVPDIPQAELPPQPLKVCAQQQLSPQTMTQICIGSNCSSFTFAPSICKLQYADLRRDLHTGRTTALHDLSVACMLNSGCMVALIFLQSPCFCPLQAQVGSHPAEAVGAWQSCCVSCCRFWRRALQLLWPSQCPSQEASLQQPQSPQPQELAACLLTAVQVSEVGLQLGSAPHAAHWCQLCASVPHTGAQLAPVF